VTEVEELLDTYTNGVLYPPSTAFAAQELLRARSRLAGHEESLSDEQSARLEDADSQLLRQTATLYDLLIGLGKLPELRRREEVPPWHWWWHLERFV